MKKILLDGEQLSAGDVVLAARGWVDEGGVQRFPEVALAPAAAKHLRAMRRGLEQLVGDRVMYGVNTGCGIRKATILPRETLAEYQKYYIPAHCVGTGEPFPESVVRAAMVLRVNSFAKGNSGVRLELCQTILDFYNAGVIPVVPQQGSVGSSGDLCPLAHMSAAMLGLEQQLVRVRGAAPVGASEAVLREAGVAPIALEAKEAMAMTNGATFILATALLAAHDAARLLRFSHAAAALSLEAIRGELAAFDVRIHAARRHGGQVRTARDILALTSGSTRCTDAAREKFLPADDKFNKEKMKVQDGPMAGRRLPRVQDAYSLRCYPQVAGATLQELEFVLGVLQNEMNASTDNPLVFERDDASGEYDVLSGGNFHGEPLGHACDLLKIAVQALANISERRFYALLMPASSYGLPADLAGASDLNTGLMILQYCAASLVSENKVLCHPASVDSIPTSANQEDYVSMGTIAARHARQVVRNATAVVAAELVGAWRGIKLTAAELAEFRLGEGTRAVYELLDAALTPLEDSDLRDRYFHDHLNAVIDLMGGDALMNAVAPFTLASEARPLAGLDPAP